MAGPAVEKRSAPVGVVRALVLAKERYQLFLMVAHKGVVVALVNGRLDKAFALAHSEVLRKLLNGIVAEAQLHE